MRNAIREKAKLDFKGKCLSIVLVDNPINHDLFDPHFEVQGGRVFLVGTVPVGATESDWVANCKGAVAWDRVLEYFVFESLEAWKKGVKRSESGSKKKKKT